jgi:hypothetical protein
MVFTCSCSGCYICWFWYCFFRILQWQAHFLLHFISARE